MLKIQIAKKLPETTETCNSIYENLFWLGSDLTLGWEYIRSNKPKDEIDFLLKQSVYHLKTIGLDSTAEICVKLEDFQKRVNGTTPEDWAISDMVQLTAELDELRLAIARKLVDFQK